MIHLFSILAYLTCFLLGAVLTVAVGTFLRKRGSSKRWMPNILRSHFRTRDPELLLVAERRFPLHMRGEVDGAIRAVFDDGVQLHGCLGIKKDYSFCEVSFAELIDSESRLFAVAPQLEEINIGGETPQQVVRNGIWLGEQSHLRFAVVSTQDESTCGGGFVRVQVATPNSEAGTHCAREIFQRCQQAVATGRSYRGKILSFEQPDSYSGETSGITIHAPRTVEREEVILPSSTLELLERNVIQFAQQRSRLARAGQSTKKGLLFYGPPGTGKTHTIHYLAKAVPDQTVFLIAAEQVKHLSDYMTLARLLQPSLVIVEDVDLIARDRSDHSDPTSEVLLNKLLNEMDGFREDAAILFVLTTNRPEALEQALSARPGRIDQAIEFPLPNESGREQLIRLYSKGVRFAEEAVVTRLVERTRGVSAAFIKEVVRRSVQYCICRNGSDQLEACDVENALEEMLTGGGTLNRRLLGAEGGQDLASDR